MARNSAPIRLIIYYPKTEQGKRELAERVASVHADAVHQHIKRLNCPTEQKLKLLNAVIDTVARKDT